MSMELLTIEQADVRKLLGAASGDAALLYLYIHSGADTAGAEKALGFTQTRMSCAAATLRQLGLWPEERKSPIIPGERPDYSEKDVLDAMDKDKSFRLLYGEVQRLMGRSLNTEELKILLGFIRYLGLPAEVISVLVSYCKERARQRGSLRNPSLRTIEKEAYSWAEQGIDTLEEAAAYIHNQSVRNSRMQQLMAQLQIRGRSLTQAEEKYAKNWLEMGFADGVIAMAYEKTCVNTGGLSWPYMNKILNSWHAAGYTTVEQIRGGDQKKNVPKGASGELGEAEMEAIRRLLQEG
jgi:DnaD/phage-associated family protein